MAEIIIHFRIDQSEHAFFNLFAIGRISILRQPKRYGAFAKVHNSHKFTVHCLHKRSLAKNARAMYVSRFAHFEFFAFQYFMFVVAPDDVRISKIVYMYV